MSRQFIESALSQYVIQEIQNIGIGQWTQEKKEGENEEKKRQQNQNKLISDGVHKIKIEFGICTVEEPVDKAIDMPNMVWSLPHFMFV